MASGQGAAGCTSSLLDTILGLLLATPALYRCCAALAPPQELVGELGAHLRNLKISVEKALRIVYQPQVGRECGEKGRGGGSRGGCRRPGRGGR